MKIKKILISCTCLVLCLLLPVRSVSAIDPNTVINAIDIALQITGFAKDAYDDYYNSIHSQSAQKAVGSLNAKQGWNSVSVLNYMFIEGKSQVRYLCTDNVERSFNVNVSMYYLDNYDSVAYGDDTAPSIEGSDGLMYLANNIYFDIWYSDTTHYRIRYKPDSYLSLIQQFDSAYTFSSSGQTLLCINRPSSGRFFNVTPQNNLIGTELTTWGNSSSKIFLYSSDRNSVVVQPLGPFYDNSPSRIEYINPTDIEITPTQSMLDGFYPTPKAICFNSQNFKSSSGSSSVTYNGIEIHYFGVFFDGNIDSINQRYIAMPQSKKYSNNYYYNNNIVGGTVINNDNKSTVLNGILSNDFDVNGLFTGIADISATLKPILDVSLPELSAKITDYFENMPDWNMSWTSERNNNYWDLPLELPDSGGSGTVEPWEPPKYPAVNTQPFIPATYPTFSVTTIPQVYGEVLGDTLSEGWDIADTLGLTAIFVPVVVIVLLWRFTGK